MLGSASTRLWKHSFLAGLNKLAPYSQLLLHYIWWNVFLLTTYKLLPNH